MRRLPWVLWLPVQAVFAMVVILALSRRRGGVLVFTHYRDLDGSGRDRQMGPLVDALRARGDRLIEVTLVPAGLAFFRNLLWKRRIFLPWAPLAALARLVSWLPAEPTPRPDEGGGTNLPDRGDSVPDSSSSGDRLRAARRRVASLLLRWTRPRIVYLVDESGSGQPLLAAARRLGIRSIGVQHGDFQPRNPQYASQPGKAFRVEPADVLATWSPWFRDRLLRISPIYDASRVRITGRLRSPPSPEEDRAASGSRRVRVLVVEGRRDEAVSLAPFVAALQSTEDLEIAVLPHPAHARGEKDPRSTFAWADVAAGTGSSALLEAIWHGCSAVVIEAGLDPDPGGYRADGVAAGADSPGALVAVCRRLGESQERARGAEIRERVWGADGGNAAKQLLGMGDGITSLY